MRTVLETDIQSVRTGPMPTSSLPRDQSTPVSLYETSVLRRRYVLKRVHPTRYKPVSPLKLYTGRITPLFDDLTIIRNGDAVIVVYEKADEVPEPILQDNELPFATVIEFTQLLIEPGAHSEPIPALTLNQTISLSAVAPPRRTCKLPSGVHRNTSKLAHRMLSAIETEDKPLPRSVSVGKRKRDVEDTAHRAFQSRRIVDDYTRPFVRVCSSLRFQLNSWWQPPL